MDIADPLRRQLKADKQSDGGVILRWGHAGMLMLSRDEVSRIYGRMNDTPTILRFPMAPKTPLEAPGTNDLAVSG
jgi:hypothetical protein